jgi:uncharacterized protein
MRLWNRTNSAPHRRRLAIAGAVLVLVVGLGAMLGWVGPGRDTGRGLAGMLPGAVEFVGARPADLPPVPELWWHAMEELNTETGEMPDSLRVLDGQVVRIPAFMVPLDDDLRKVREFLLVPWPGACVHTPPPPPNQIVYGRVQGERYAEVAWWRPIWVEGRLRIEATQSLYGSVGYQIEVEYIEPYTEYEVEEWEDEQEW